jgi:hypothetical protein
MPPTNSSAHRPSFAHANAPSREIEPRWWVEQFISGAVQWSRFQRNLVHSLPYLHCKRLHHFAEAAKMM